MFSFKLAVSVLAVLYLGSVDAKFPDDPKPCKYGDSDCLIKIMNYFLNEKSDGDSSINLVKVDPLRVSKINIKQGGDSPVNIDLEFSKTDIYGLKSASVVKVKGFGKDMTEKHEIHLKLKTLGQLSDYKINGRVIILPIKGNGPSNMTMVNVDMVLAFSGTPVEKDGATYMNIDNLKITRIDPERLFYYFGNLFNGDKALGDNMNAFLNENWLDIFNEVRASLTEAYAKIFQSVIKNVFTKYPYDKFFEA